MSFLADLATGGASGIFGGITGLISTFAQSKMQKRQEIAEAKARQDNQAFELAMRELDHKGEKQENELMIQREAAAAAVTAASEVRQAQVRLEESDNETDVALRAQVTANDKATYGIKKVDTWRGLVRPVMAYLLWAELLLIVVVHGLMLAFGNEGAHAFITSGPVQTVEFLAVTAIISYYGGRILDKRRQTGGMLPA